MSDFRDGLRAFTTGLPDRIVIDTDVRPRLGALSDACEAEDLDTTMNIVIQAAARGRLDPQDPWCMEAVILVTLAAYLGQEGDVLRLPSQVLGGLQELETQSLQLVELGRRETSIRSAFAVGESAPRQVAEVVQSVVDLLS